MDKAVKAKIEKFFEAYPARKWPAKHIIIHAGDEPQGIYYIEKGGVRQYTIDQRGEEIVVNSFHNPAFIPMFWAFNDEPCKYFFETSDDTTLRCAPKEDIVVFLKKNPDVVFDLLGRLYAGLDGVLMRMVHLMSGTAYTRILHELIIQVKRLHPKDSSEVLLPLKEYQLGSYCGLTKETVSREFKKLKQKKLVSVDSAGITVKDVKKLQEELELIS